MGLFPEAVSPADHLAVAAFEPPDAAAGADVNVVNAFGSEFLGAANVVDVVRVAAVDEDVVLAEFGSEIGDGGVNDGGGNHQPDGPRLLKFADEVVDGRGAGGAFTNKLLHRFRAAVVDDALMAIFLEAPHHVGAHSAQSDHAELH